MGLFRNLGAGAVREGANVAVLDDATIGELHVVDVRVVARGTAPEGAPNLVGQEVRASNGADVAGFAQDGNDLRLGHSFGDAFDAARAGGATGKPEGQTS